MKQYINRTSSDFSVTIHRVLAVCAVVALTLTACSTVDTKIDKKAVKAQTFSFLDTGGKPAPGYAEDRQQAHQMLHQAIIKTLADKGVSNVPSGGDVTVAYLAIVGNNAETTSLNRYFGYTPDATALVERVHEQETVKNENRQYFEAGTLVIDFLDPKTSTVLQRRTIRADMLRNLPAETRIARLQAVVDQALADVHISH